VDERRGVGDPATHRRFGQQLRKTDDHRGRAAGRPAPDPRHQSIQAAHARLHEGVSLQQVARRIARERQLGKHQEIGSRCLGRRQRLLGQAQVAVEVPHRGVDLPECDLHRREVSSFTTEITEQPDGRNQRDHSGHGHGHDLLQLPWRCRESSQGVKSHFVFSDSVASPLPSVCSAAGG